jgi:hypothetical protein
MTGANARLPRLAAPAETVAMDVDKALVATDGKQFYEATIFSIWAFARSSEALTSPFTRALETSD